ncbi:MAG: 50S ribosomal protein L10 [Planctomycetes bacterium]|nr:50S ribosomal protein L10 [Planctomycetota bacterium]NUQ35002.1 50S ribosomal protein L10 [Planctomycetaceae bacterium]
MPSKLNMLLEDQLRRDFAEIDNMLLVDYQGLNSEKMAEFRTKLRKSGLTMEVVKNTLFQRIAKEGKGKAIVEDPKGKLGSSGAFKGPVGIIYGGETVIDSARFAIKWLKDNENTIVLKGALMGEEVFAPGEIAALSKLPGRKELLGMMVNGIQAPIQKLAATMQAGYSRVLWAFNALAEKLEKKG